MSVACIRGEAAAIPAEGLSGHAPVAPFAPEGEAACCGLELGAKECDSHPRAPQQCGTGSWVREAGDDVRHGAELARLDDELHENGETPAAYDCPACIPAMCGMGAPCGTSTMCWGRRCATFGAGHVPDICLPEATDDRRPDGATKLETAPAMLSPTRGVDEECWKLRTPSGQEPTPPPWTV